MKFLEGQGDFINFDSDDEESDQCMCKCHECQVEFLVGVDEEPDQCPSCGADFDFGTDG